jgi:hypothetical protein
VFPTPNNQPTDFMLLSSTQGLRCQALLLLLVARQGTIPLELCPQPFVCFVFFYCIGTSHNVTQADLELEILLPLPPEC